MRYSGYALLFSYIIYKIEPPEFPVTLSNILLVPGIKGGMMKELFAAVLKDSPMITFVQKICLDPVAIE